MPKPLLIHFIQSFLLTLRHSMQPRRLCGRCPNPLQRRKGPQLTLIGARFVAACQGLNHALIVAGSAVALAATAQQLRRPLVSRFVLWAYEWAIVSELIVYGPQYFWVLTSVRAGVHQRK